MKNRLLHWRYLGGTKESLYAFAPKVYEDNIILLRYISSFTTYVGLVMFVLFFFIDFQISRQFFLALASVASFVIRILSTKCLEHSDSDFVGRATTIIVAFIAVSYALFIASGLIELNMPGVLIVAVLLATQVCFDLYPIVNLSVTAVAYLSFISLSFALKIPRAFLFDLIDASLVAWLGLVISWRKSRTAWDRARALQALSEQNRLLYESSVSDPLTGLPNRRNAFEQMDSLIRKAYREVTVFACMLVDIDSFKLYNGKYGHPAGDELLQRFGALLGQVGHEHNIIISRISGERFMAFWLPEANAETSIVADEILKGIQRLYTNDERECPTVSIGIYKNVPTAILNSASAYTYADKALYMAKENGRNRIEYYRE